jgi:predicted nuclease of predicted toxin-antitoxin system
VSGSWRFQSRWHEVKTDENLPGEVVEVLARHGHDAISVIDQRLAGHPDTEVAHVCQAVGRALVTLDFADVRADPPDQFAGLIVLRPRTQTIPAIEHLTEQRVRDLHNEPLVGHLWIVEEQRLRIRAAGTGDSSRVACVPSRAGTHRLWARACARCVPARARRIR